VPPQGRKPGQTGTRGQPAARKRPPISSGPAPRVALRRRARPRPRPAPGFLPILPPGESLAGVYAMKGEVGAWPDHIVSAISFPVPLASPPTAHFVPYGSTPPTECPGSVDDPQALPGHFCVYENYTGWVSNTREMIIYDPITEWGPASSRLGAGLDLQPKNPGTVSSQGTWAVTAP
jgi:hypothetical protein